MPKKSGSLLEYKRPQFNFYLGFAKLYLGYQTKIMGILNVTPDSFSDGGHFDNPKAAVNSALKMEREGAHLIDVGGESSRPGARPVSAKEEIRRVRPVLKILSKKLKIPISIDTYKYEVAAAALDEGAVLVNDIQALRSNRRLARRIARYKAGVVLMHMKGTPRSMQKKTFYRDLLKEIRLSLRRAADVALEAGIPRHSIAIDPGFGFGKTPEQNIALLGRLDELAQLQYPILVGLSRKSFIGNVLAVASPQERLYGSLGAAAVAIARGAHLLRVHDVLPHQQLAALLDKCHPQKLAWRQAFRQ